MSYVSMRRSRQALAVLLVAPFMAQADATIANVATPSIHEDLGASGALLELVVGGYLIAFAVLLITGARLGETFGYRRVFLLGVGLFTAASLLCGLAASPIMLVLARILQGFGAALMFPQTLTGIQLNFDGDERRRAIGLYAIALSTGAVTGQLLGGLLISANLAGTQWRAIFLVNVPVGALVVLAALRYLPPDTHRTSRRLDLLGVAALSAAVLLVVVPVVTGRDVGWPAWTWICLALAGPAMVGFLAIQRWVAARGGEPLVAGRAQRGAADDPLRRRRPRPRRAVQRADRTPHRDRSGRLRRRDQRGQHDDHAGWRCDQRCRVRYVVSRSC
jgi:MFS family permease